VPIRRIPTGWSIARDETPVKPPPHPRFRKATREDADLIVRLIDISSHGGIGAHYRQIYGEGIDWRDRARLEIASGGPELGFQNAVFIAAGAEIAGGMILNPINQQIVFTGPAEGRAGQIERLIARAPGALFIRELAVFPSFRGRGYARMLIDFAREHAQTSGMNGVSLTVNAINAEARALYDSSGFVELTRSAIDGQDVMLMAMDRR
jgi:ribosomal protein S18 acetylase RimI-like enzyme